MMLGSHRESGGAAIGPREVVVSREKEL